MQAIPSQPPPPIQSPDSQNVSQTENNESLVETIPPLLIQTSSQIQELIQEHFMVLHCSPILEPSKIDINKLEIIILGEMHTTDSHAISNAHIVNFLWSIHQNNLILYTEDGVKPGYSPGQGRFVHKDVLTTCWDTSKPPELKIALKNNYELAKKSIFEINRLQSSLNSLLNKTLLDKNKLLDIKTDCDTLIEHIRQECKKFSKIVKSTQSKRDIVLAQHIQEAKGKLQAVKKIVIIAGVGHLDPCIKFLHTQSYPSLVLNPVTSKKGTEMHTQADLNLNMEGFEPTNLHKVLNREVSKLSDFNIITSMDNNFICRRVEILAIMLTNLCDCFNDI